MYGVSEGRVRTWSLEAHVADHCNLRCRNCCTLSPRLPPRFTAPAELARDLALARTALAPSVLKVTGGEPLLHPDILGVLEAARASGIAPHVQVTTNGFLLDRVPDRFWTLVDRLTLSRYTSASLPGEAVDRARARCAERNVLLTVKDVAEFGVMDAAPPGNPPEKAREVCRACWLKVRCHMIHGGRFYPCTRPPHLQAVLSGGGAGPNLAEADGVDLVGPDLAERILAKLESPEPFASCSFCLGASGGRESHRQES
jgi:hypothetical protein